MGKIVNSSAGNTFFDIAGNAINNVAYKPDVDAGAIAGVGSASVAGGRVLGYQPAITNMVDIEYSGVASIAYTSLAKSSAANQTSQPDNQRAKLRTVKVATAIRNDQWVPYSGVFSPAPSTADDTSATSLASDNAARTETKTRVSYGIGVGSNPSQSLS